MRQPGHGVGDYGKSNGRNANLKSGFYSALEIISKL